MLTGISIRRISVVTLIHCIYASRASVALSEADLHSLLERSRSKNLARRITGMLLFIEGSFFQVLEAMRQRWTKSTKSSRRTHATIA